MVEDLKKFPYKPTVSKKNPMAFCQRLAFCQRFVTMAEENFELKKISFSDESQVYLDDVPNRQNNISWMEAKPNFNQQRPLHSIKVTVWVGMSATKIFGLYFFEQEDGKALTVNTARYVAISEQEFDNETLDNLSDHFYQQDGATCHFIGCYGWHSWKTISRAD